MSLQRLSAGRMRPSAATWNAMAAAAERVQASARGPNDGSLPVPRWADRASVKNVSGGNLPAGSVVELGDYLFDEATNEALWFESEKPADLAGVHGILRDPLPDGQIGEAQLLGVVVARVAVNDVAHTCCLVVESDTELKSAPIGPHRLIHAPDTGSQLCAVILGGGILLAHGVAVDEIEQDATGTITIAGKEVEAKNHTGPTIEEGARVRAYIESGEVCAEPLECSS